MEPESVEGRTAEEQTTIEPEDVKGIRSALVRYRVMAYVVGVLLVVLVLVGMPLKYTWGDGRVVVWTGIPHGWLYILSWTSRVGIA